MALEDLVSKLGNIFKPDTWNNFNVYGKVTNHGGQQVNKMSPVSPKKTTNVDDQINKLMSQYIEYVSDRLLKMFGIDPIYNVTNPFGFIITCWHKICS